MLRVAVALSSSGGVAIRFVLPVSQDDLILAQNGQNRLRCRLSSYTVDNVAYLLTVQVGVGERVNADQLRAIVSANQSYTTLIESNFTLLETSLTDKLTAILCNSTYNSHTQC